MMFNSCELYQLRVFSSTVKQEAEREEHYDRLLPLPIWQRVCLSFFSRLETTLILWPRSGVLKLGKRRERVVVEMKKWVQLKRWWRSWWNWRWSLRGAEGKGKEITERGEKEGKGDKEKRHGEVKQDQKELRRQRKRWGEKGEKKEKIRRRGNRVLERKGRDCARDEGARILRNKGRKGGPEIWKWTVRVTNTRTKWANEIASATNAFTVATAESFTAESATTKIWNVAASNDASFDQSDTGISTTF